MPCSVVWGEHKRDFRNEFKTDVNQTSVEGNDNKIERNMESVLGMCSSTFVSGGQSLVSWGPGVEAIMNAASATRTTNEMRERERRWEGLAA